MAINATFWVGVSFILFFAVLIYLKVPQKVNEILNNLISNIKNEIDESEKLRAEAKVLLDNSQIKLESAQNDSKKIINETKKESLEKEIDQEIKKAEAEILDLKNKSPEKINKIAIETSVHLIQHIIGVEVNNSNISAIVEDISKKNKEKYYGN